MLSRYQQLAARAARSHVALFVVHLDQAEFDASDRGHYAQVFGGREYASGLGNIASVTGGQFFSGVGRATGVFDRIASSINHFYQLGVESRPSDGDGKPHKVEVKVTRASTRVTAPAETTVVPRAGALRRRSDQDGAERTDRHPGTGAGGGAVPHAQQRPGQGPRHCRGRGVAGRGRDAGRLGLRDQGRQQGRNRQSDPHRDPGGGRRGRRRRASMCRPAATICRPRSCRPMDAWARSTSRCASGSAWRASSIPAISCSGRSMVDSSSRTRACARMSGASG